MDVEESGYNYSYYNQCHIGHVPKMIRPVLALSPGRPSFYRVSMLHTEKRAASCNIEKLGMSLGTNWVMKLWVSTSIDSTKDMCCYGKKISAGFCILHVDNNFGNKVLQCTRFRSILCVHAWIIQTLKMLSKHSA